MKEKHTKKKHLPVWQKGVLNTG